MSAHAIIGSYTPAGSSTAEILTLNFEFWRGGAPPVIAENVATFTRPGADGVAQQKLGRWGRSFTAQLVSHWPNYQAGLQFLGLYAQLVGVGPVKVIYNFRDWRASFGIDFLVERMNFVDARANVRLIGPNYDYPNGGELITEWQMVPIDVSS